MKVQDKLWLFASRAHDDDLYLGRSSSGRFMKRSRITPAEGAAILDVPNVIMVVSDGVPSAYSDDAYGYMESFCRMKNVWWSVTGSAGFRAGNEERFIASLAERYPNVTGAFADDLIGCGPLSKLPRSERLAAIRSIREVLDTACRPLSLCMTFYINHIDDCDTELCDIFDGISLWTPKYRDLENLRENFEAVERKLPRHKKYLGIYMLEYSSGEPIPDEYMKLQCEYGLELLKSRRIEGMIFLTNCVMGVGLPSEKWLRSWIDDVKNSEL